MKNQTADEKQFLAAALESRFQPSATDWVGTVGGWRTRPDTQHFQAEPALWTLMALARILQDKSVGDTESRSRLTTRARDIQKYLSDNRFFVTNVDQLAFNVVANQQDPQSHSAYTTSLALLALIEMRRAGLAWDQTDPDVMIRGILEWFNARYDERQQGWSSIDGDTDVDLPDEAVNLQIMATMLEAYAELQLELPAELLSRVDDHLTLLAHSEPADSEARATPLSIGSTNETSDNEVRISFLGRPAAIRLCRQWLRTVSPTAEPEDKVRVLGLMQKLSTDLDGTLRIDREALTFKSAEMLLALS
jgi:hypothetical protein